MFEQSCGFAEIVTDSLGKLETVSERAWVLVWFLSSEWKDIYFPVEEGQLECTRS